MFLLQKGIFAPNRQLLCFAIFTGSDCLRVCVNIELFNIEQRRFLHNLKWKQPKSPLQIVVLVEGEIEGRVSIASTASQYPLAIFQIFRSLARKWKMLVGIIPNPYEERRRRMANRKRNIQMKFYVTENKKRLIDERIKLIASLPHSISFSFGNELKAEICNSSS